MIRINLLPHREAKRKELKQNFVAMLVLAAALAGVVVLAVGFYLSMQMDNQNARNAHIKKVNLELDEKIKEVNTLTQEIDALKARQQAVEDLQSDRNQPVYMMNELVALAPEGLHLTVIKQDGQRIALKGFSQSHAIVANFVESLKQNKWMSKPEIVQNKAIIQGQGRDSKRVIEFDLSVFVKRPREIEAAEKAKLAGAAASSSAIAVVSGVSASTVSTDRK